MKSNYKISRHACERYRQRIRPVSLKEAKGEIERLVESAEWSERLPSWVKQATDRMDGCLVVADMVLIVQGGVIVTCISRGWIPPGLRAHRKVKKKERKERLARRRGL